MDIKLDAVPNTGMAAIGADKKTVTHCHNADQNKIIEM